MTKPAYLLLLPPLLCVCLSGCALFESKATRAMRNSPDYKAGYSDGCDSASAVSANPRADTQVRDDQAYSQIPAYRMGWNEGHGACRPLTALPGSAMDPPR